MAVDTAKPNPKAHSIPAPIYADKGHQYVAATPVSTMSEADLAKFVIQSVTPAPLPQRLSDDVHLFTKAVNDVAIAARQNVITAQEANALIGYLTEQFAARRAIYAFSRVGTFAMLR
jgi:hypothetical protein